MNTPKLAIGFSSGVMAVCCLLLAPCAADPARAELSKPATPAELRASVRSLQQEGSFEPALAMLDSTVRSDSVSLDLLREAYLLLVETHVLYGNAFEYPRQQPSTARLHWERARDRARECLENPALRDTDPNTVDDFPELGRQIFDELKREMFGSFKITELQPEDAEVRLDGVLLDQMPGDARLGVLYVPVGDHSVLVRREGYEDLVETVSIEGGSSLLRSYSLSRGRDLRWYLVRGTGLAALAGIAWLIWPDDPPPPEAALPDPPSPPQ